MSQDFKNLTVVGDDNQSIYAFRYANIDNILNFDKVYPNCRTFVLDTNYRSSQEILDFANAVMKYATEGKKKILKGTFNGKKPQMIVKNDCYQEADYILEKIVNRKCDLSDIAVICRSATQSYILEQKLNMYGIPYNKYGGLKFMEKVVIKDLLAFLRISVNQQDEIAMFRILQLYPGIGKTYGRKISEIISKESFEKAKEKYKKRAFVQYIEELETIINKLNSLNLAEQMSFLINDYYEKTISRSIAMQSITDGKKSELYVSLKESMEDAKILASMASKYRNTSTFLNDIVLDATTEDDDEDKLNITTIHSAKGLEYDTVFLMDCVDGVTPKCEEGDEEDPEELRCVYVAITRAKKELYIMIPEYYNMRNMRCSLSHFFNKIDIINSAQRNVPNNKILSLCYKRTYSF